MYWVAGDREKAEAVLDELKKDTTALLVKDCRTQLIKVLPTDQETFGRPRIQSHA